MLPLNQTWSIDAGNDWPFSLIEFEGNQTPSYAVLLKESHTSMYSFTKGVAHLDVQM